MTERKALVVTSSKLNVKIRKGIRTKTSQTNPKIEESSIPKNTVRTSDELSSSTSSFFGLAGACRAGFFSESLSFSFSTDTFKSSVPTHASLTGERAFSTSFTISTVLGVKLLMAGC
jgi:hypothetical protein